MANQKLDSIPHRKINRADTFSDPDILLHLGLGLVLLPGCVFADNLRHAYSSLDLSQDLLVTCAPL